MGVTKITKDQAWKAYFITCELLAIFQEYGVYSIMAERDLFFETIDYLGGKLEQKEYLIMLEDCFGLKLKHFKQAIRNYEKNEKNMKIMEEITG